MKFRNDIKMPEIQIKQVLNVKDIGWCDEAVLICVKRWFLLFCT